MSVTENIQKQLNEAGYDNAIAVATEAEIQAGAACGQLAMVVECDEKDEQ